MDEDIAAFKRFARDAWAAEMKAMAPKIMQQPKTEPKPDISSASKRERPRRRAAGNAIPCSALEAGRRIFLPWTKTLAALRVACRPSTVEFTSRQSPLNFLAF